MASSDAGADVEMGRETLQPLLIQPTDSPQGRVEAAKDRFLNHHSDVNPFEQRTVGLFSSPARSFKTIILIPLVLVRIVLCVLTLVLIALLATIGIKVACMGPPKAADSNPVKLPLHSQIFLYPIRYLIRLLLVFFGFHWVTWTGRPAPKSEAPLMVPSHQSWVETFYLTGLRWCSGMADFGIINQPVVGSVLHALQFVLVDRDDPDSRTKAAEAMLERCQDPDGPVFMIFPEGVCTSGSHLVQFKDGVFRTGLSVQPVGISYPFEKWCSGYHPKNPMDPKLVIPHFFRALFEFHNPMHVHWCAPYHPSEEEKKDSQLYARKVRAKMAEETGKCLTDHAFEDVRLAMVAKREFKIEQADWALVESGKYYETLHFNFDDAEKIMKRFLNLYGARTGKVNKDQFLKALGLQRTAVTEELFQSYDLDGDGEISFREYMCAHAIFRGIGPGKKREDERSVSGGLLHHDSLDAGWCILTGEVPEGETTVKFQDLKKILGRYAMHTQDDTTSQQLLDGAARLLFDKAMVGKPAFDREAFEAFMTSTPEYMQLVRLGERRRMKTQKE